MPEGLKLIESWYTDQVLAWINALTFRTWLEEGCDDRVAWIIVRRG